MKLPWRDDKAVPSNNRVMAEKQHKSLKAKLLAKDELKSKYADKINEYIKSGHASSTLKDITPNKTFDIYRTTAREISSELYLIVLLSLKAFLSMKNFFRDQT